jgi:AraC family transcriptional regulator, arabinose operon regulatory protein
MDVIRSDYRIERAVRLLNENSSCTLADLASNCTLSISRLSHLFKVNTGLTVGSFRRKCQLRTAMKMLATTDMPIKQIASALGYRHTSSFVRAFEFHTGVSPSDYRRYEIREHNAAVADDRQRIQTRMKRDDAGRAAG